MEDDGYCPSTKPLERAPLFFNSHTGLRERNDILEERNPNELDPDVREAYERALAINAALQPIVDDLDGQSEGGASHFFYSLTEEYFALAVADPIDSPDEIDLRFEWEGLHSPLMELDDYVDWEVRAVGDFLPVETTFPGKTPDEHIAQWELNYGQKWNESLVLRAFKIRLDVFFSQEYLGEFSPKDLGDSLEVDYLFGMTQIGLLELELAWWASCAANSEEELERCRELQNPQK